MLGEVLSTIETGGRPKGGVSGITNGIPSVGAESITGVGQFDFGKTKFVPVEYYGSMKKGHIQSMDVLFKRMVVDLVNTSHTSACLEMGFRLRSAVSTNTSIDFEQPND